MNYSTRMSFLAPTGSSESQCGYCHSTTPTSKSHGAWAYSLSPSAYQALIDHGWRRSGQYLYKPAPTTCCKAYTIRLDSTKFNLSKGQKKTLKKMKKYIVDGVGKVVVTETETDDMVDTVGSMVDERVTGSKDIPKSMQNTDNTKQCVERSSSDMQRDTDLDPSGPITTLLLTSEGGNCSSSKNAFRTELVQSEYDDETFELYKKYQMAIHKDPADKLSPKSYKRFLVDSPIQFQPLTGPHRIPGYGSFHQKYYINNHLIAVGVIDILPHCVSSVYFMYDPTYAFLSLGVYGAVREIGLTWSLAQSLPQLKYYYMGYYIHTCEKMKYKANYKPSDLLCPVTYNWIPVEQSVPELELSPFTALVGSTPSMESLINAASNVPPSRIAMLKVYQKGQLIMEKDAQLSVEELDEIRLLVDVLGPSLFPGFIYVVS